MQIALIGENGFIGQAFKKQHKLVPATDADVIVFLTGRTGTDQTALVQDNVAFTAKYTQTVTKPIVFASTYAVYAGRNPYYETSETNPTDFYGVTKLAAEGAVKVNCKRWMIARIANVYGEGDNSARLVPSAIQAILQNKPLQVSANHKTVLRDYIHVDDVVKALWTLANATVNLEPNGIFNVGASLPISGETLCRTIENVLKTKLKYEITDKPTREEKRYVSINKMINHFGWQPETKLITGINRTAQYFKDLQNQKS